MDIKCERCGTEYEFEDSRVTEEGVTVKCSTCGHLFKIRRKSFVLTEPVTLNKKGEEEGAGRNWMVRKIDGTILSFKELTTLQKWIVERKVSREDEISKKGESWKRLGEIVELASFFQVVEQADAAVPRSTSSTQPLPAAVPPGQSSPPLAVSYPAQPSVPPPGMPARANSAGGVSQPPGYLPASGLAFQGPSAKSATELGADRPPPAVARTNEPEFWGEGPMTDSGAEDDVVAKWKKRGRRKWYIITLFLMIGLGLGGWYLADPESFLKVLASITGKSEAVPELAKTQFDSGYLALLKDSDGSVDKAIDDLKQAVQTANERFPKAMGVLAEAYLTRADKRRFKIRQLESAGEEIQKQLGQLKPKDSNVPPDLVTKINALEGERKKIENEKISRSAELDLDLQEANKWIGEAFKQDPSVFEAKRAQADYVRIRNDDRQQVEGILQQAKALVQKDDAELLFIEGAILADDPKALHDPQTLEGAKNKLQQALEGLPGLLRARYKMAEVLIRLKKPEEAKVQLARILSESQDHEQAKMLLSSLEPPKTEPPKVEEKPKDAAAPTTYEAWMALAEGFQKKEQCKKAIEAFDSALLLKPGDVEATTNKAYCLLDLGSNSAAINWFKRALQANERFGPAIIGIAEAHKYMGNVVEAKKFYKKYLKMFPGGPDATVAKNALEELK